MIGIAVGWAYAHIGEWMIHKYVLHGAAKKRGHPLSFHFHEHHRASRQNSFQDPIYDKSVFHWNAAGKEALGLALMSVAHLSLFPVAPFFSATVLASTVQYYRVHKRAHVDPEWARANLPWHYAHHMAPNQDANYGIRSDWVDRMMGTREYYVGTEREEKDQARRAKKAA